MDLDLRLLDSLEVRGHSFERIRLDKPYDFWVARYAIDGVLREEMIIPHEDVVKLGLKQGTPEFEAFMQAQCLSAPVEVKCG